MVSLKQGCQTQIHRGPDLKTPSKTRAGHNQYLLKTKKKIYFFICKHELKFNIGLLNLGQAGLILGLLVIAYKQRDQISK